MPSIAAVMFDTTPSTCSVTLQDKIQSYWDITRKDLERSRADVRNKDREMEDLQEQQQIELKVLDCLHEQYVKLACALPGIQPT